MDDGDKKNKYRFRHMNQDKAFGKHISERRINASMIMLHNLLDLKKWGLWQEYEKEADPDYTLEHMIEYYKDGGLYGWVAIDKDRKQLAGFVLAVLTDYNLEPAFLGTNVYIKPEYRLTNIDALMYDGIKVFAKILKVKHICVMADDMRIARWILRRYAPDNVVILLERTV